MNFTEFLIGTLIYMGVLIASAILSTLLAGAGLFFIVLIFGRMLV